MILWHSCFTSYLPVDMLIIFSQKCQWIQSRPRVLYFTHCQIQIDKQLSCFWNNTKQVNSSTFFPNLLWRRNLWCYKQSRSMMRGDPACFNTSVSRDARELCENSQSIKFPKKGFELMLVSKMLLLLKSSECFKNFVPSISNTQLR